MAIVCGLLGLAILVTAAALFWDCCRCRRRKDEVRWLGGVLAAGSTWQCARPTAQHDSATEPRLHASSTAACQPSSSSTPGQQQVAEVRDSVRAAIAKKKGGKGDDAKKAAQNEATKRLAALGESSWGVAPWGEGWRRAVEPPCSTPLHRSFNPCSPTACSRTPPPAADLARAVRETKMEAQAAAPRFEVVVTAGSASAPSSPARSRFQRVRSAVNPFS